MSGDEQEQYDQDQEIQKPGHGNYGRLRSGVWDHFTVLSRKNYLAACNYCNSRLSFKTTVTNLKKHIVRKHRHLPDRPPVSQRSFLQRPQQDSSIRKLSKPLKRNYSTQHVVHKPSKPFIQRAKLTDLGGLEGLVLNIIGEDGETDTVITDHEEVHEEEIYTEVENDQEEIPPSKEYRANNTKQTKSIDPAEQERRSRIMDLQLECLEIKKYNMQLEALMLEQQLNIRRSIFTEPLHCPDTFTRGVQTDVGGENTRVYYLTDNKGSLPRRHLFAMQDLE